MSEHLKSTLEQFRRPLIHLPDEWLPPAEKLPGELKHIAQTLDAHLPGLGVRITLILAQSYPSQPLYMHSADKFLKSWRDDIMRALYDQDVTAHTLAGLSGLSERQVWNILSRPDSQDELKKKQLKLFER